MNIRRRLYLYGGLLLLAIVTMIALGRLSREGEISLDQPQVRDYPEVAQEGILRILAAFNAYDYRGQTDRMTGRVYELAQRLSVRTGLQVDVVLENDPSRGLKMLESGEVDLIASPRIRTLDVDTMRFVWVQDATSGPVYLVYRRDSLQAPIRDHIDLKDKTITLPKSSDLRLFVEHLREEIGEGVHLELDPLYSTEQLIILVASGKRAYTLCSSSEAEYYRQKFPELDISLPMSHNLREGWLMRRTSTQLIDSLSIWLR